MKTCCGCFSTKSGTFAVLLLYAVNIFLDMWLMIQKLLKPKIGFRSYLNHQFTIYLRRLILLASLLYLSTLRETNMKNGIKSPSLIPRSGKRNALVLKTWSYGNAKHHSTCNMVFDQFCSKNFNWFIILNQNQTMQNM